ncbi:MAG: TetR/AcrR family transcriptional regulator [Bacteroidota bacterium]
MNEIEKIIEHAEEKFFREGFYKTTMDEVAADLQMSKKTIYKFFPSKNELVKAAAHHFMNKMNGKILPALNSDKNAIAKLADLISLLASVSVKVSPKMLGELKKHMPSLWDEIDRFRTEMMMNNISKVIDQGKAEGLFLDYPTSILITVFVSSARSVVNPEFILANNFSIIQAARTAFLVIIGGMLTEKGREVFNETLNKEKI